MGIHNDGTAWVEEMTVSQIQEMMDRGELTSAQLVLTYMERIAALDRNGPGINSVLELNPDAVQIAEALDRERKIRGPRGPLHGIPVLLKDNIDTGDKMHTSAGSLALANSYAPRDSFIAARLRRAGAVILGKANMTEWANFMTDNMPNGYSSRGGQVLNPYGPGKHDVGGSSSGSAAAVAANLVTLAVGTETSGSIINPSASNSVIGIKPTVGLISRTGLIPISWSQDTAGPIARTVYDAALLLGAMAGPDEEDPVTWASVDYLLECAGGILRTFGLACTQSGVSENTASGCNLFTDCLDPSALKGSRLGLPRDPWDKVEGARASVLKQALAALKDEGAQLLEVDPLPVIRDITVLIHEFKVGINAYLAKLSPSVPAHSLDELIEFNRKDPGKMLRYGQSLLLASQRTSGTLKEPEYIEARMRDLKLCRYMGIDRIIDENRLDAIVLPHSAGIGVPARAGYPSVTVPAGYTDEGRPVGITFTGKAWWEPHLIRLAYAFERATKFRKPPALTHSGTAGLVKPEV